MAVRIELKMRFLKNIFFNGNSDVDVPDRSVIVRFIRRYNIDVAGYSLICIVSMGAHYITATTATKKNVKNGQIDQAQAMRYQHVRGEGSKFGIHHRNCSLAGYPC